MGKILSHRPFGGAFGSRFLDRKALAGIPFLLKPGIPWGKLPQA
jgi:hypothetical protein